MSNSGSVAPKERIKITYKPDLGNAVEERELPLRLMVMGDFTGREDDTPLEERTPMTVDKHNFEEVLASQNVSMDLAVKNELSGVEGDELGVHLDIRSMKDFSPESIARQMPELRKLLEIREALVALKAPLTNNTRFRKSLQSLVEDEGQRQSVLDELDMGTGDEK